MAHEVFYGVNQWILLLITIGLLYGSAEVGFRVGRRSATQIPADAHSHVATIEAALLGLLALLLGFAFAMAVSRFDVRKQAVLEEANDLQTAYLRAKLLPASHRDRCAQLLGDYVVSRIDYYQAGVNPELARTALERIRGLQAQLWAEAAAAVRENPEEGALGYFIETLNRLINNHNRRSEAMDNHVPEVILWLLLFMACMTVAVTGYSSGLKHLRLVGLRLILSVLIAASLFVIVDLDRPRRGLIKVSEDRLVTLRDQLEIYDR